MLDVADDTRFVYTQTIGDRFIYFILIFSIFAGEIIYISFVIVQSTERIMQVFGISQANLRNRFKLGAIEAFGLTPFFFK